MSSKGDSLAEWMLSFYSHLVSTQAFSSVSSVTPGVPSFSPESMREVWSGARAQGFLVIMASQFMTLWAPPPREHVRIPSRICSGIWLEGSSNLENLVHFMSKSAWTEIRPRAGHGQGQPQRDIPQPRWCVRSQLGLGTRVRTHSTWRPRNPRKADAENDDAPGDRQLGLGFEPEP